MAGVYFPEGFFPTTLSSDINGSTTTIPLTAVPSRVTSGYMVIEPTSATKREVIHFTSVGVSSVTTADDTTDASDASGRGCTGSIATGANTTHLQGATVLIAATEQYWARLRSALGSIIDLTTGDIDYTELASALYAADAGSNDTYAITLSPVPAAYADITGLSISFKANTANTGAATLNVNSLGAKTIKKNHDQDLSDNDIESGQIVTVVYDGTNFQMQSQIANTISLSTDGWTADTATWTYASASTFTVSGDVTAQFRVGTKLKFTQTTVKYAVVVSSTYGAPNTTVTIAVNTDYTIANAAISSTYYSYAESPQGYPEWYSYTPTFTGFSSSPTGTFRYTVKGRTCIVKHYTSGAGASNATGFTITMPVTSASAGDHFFQILAVDNSAETIATAKIPASSATMTLYKGTSSSATWTGTNNKYAFFVVSYEI